MSFARVAVKGMWPVVAAVCAMLAARGVRAVDASGQAPGVKMPGTSLVVRSMMGRDLFDAYCVPCHGRAGQGNGPAAGNLAVRPADLTTIAISQGGVFPRDRIRALIAGTGALAPSHLSGDMPVWGEVFRGLDPNEKLNQIRVSNIADYIASLQVQHKTGALP